MVRVHQPPGGDTHLNDDLPKEHLNVRVQQPPGGKSHIDEELAPENTKVRVLKPPGGGSSISFGDDDNLSNVRGKSTPEQEAPKNDNQEQQSPKAETNGMSSPPPTPKENGTNSVKENSPSTATNTATTNGVALNGTVTNGTTSGSSTPNSSRLDTQNRLFGDEPNKEMANRRVRDHHRSNIFSDAEGNIPSKSVYRRPWARRDPVTGVGVLCWDLHAPRFAPIKRKANPVGSETPEPKTPEVKTPEKSQPQIQQQRQRVPPGGFSSKLW